MRIPEIEITMTTYIKLNSLKDYEIFKKTAEELGYSSGYESNDEWVKCFTAARFKYLYGYLYDDNNPPIWDTNTFVPSEIDEGLLLAEWIGQVSSGPPLTIESCEYEYLKNL